MTTHLTRQADASHAPTTPLSPLEIAGAISGRVIHDLSNLMSGIVGNAEYAQNPEVSPDGVRKAVQAIGVSANAAGKLLGQCLPLQAIMAGAAFALEISELALIIAESSGLAPGWRVLEPAPLAGSVRIQPRWLSAAIWQIAREADSAHGEVEFLSGPAAFPVVWHGANGPAGRNPDLFQITLRYRADHALFVKDGPAQPERLGLFAVHEIVRRARGQIHARPKSPGRQEISVLIPLL